MIDQIVYKTTDDKIAITYKGNVESNEDSTWDDVSTQLISVNNKKYLKLFEFKHYKYNSYVYF